MGCSSSKSKVAVACSDDVAKHYNTRKSTTETKIYQALLKKKMEHAVSDRPMTFERILLKFDKIRLILGYVKTVFNQVATDGKLDKQSLEMTMKRLDVNMTFDDILDLFDFIDVREKHEISLKEFLTALTIGMVLDVIPALSRPAQTRSDGRPMIKRSFSGLMGHTGEIKDMLNLIVSAYLLFDPDGKGYIEKTAVDQMLVEAGSKKKQNALLSGSRWSEMDWDGNGTIDFAEFVFTFTTWVEIENDEEEEDGGDEKDAMGDSAAAVAAAAGAAAATAAAASVAPETVPEETVEGSSTGPAAPNTN